MPIKFRCSYCRQFLGISRARAGEIVDCPTCGRSIRVPGVDGSVAPLPQPEWNAEDAHLARALEELAQLEHAEVRPVVAAEAAAEQEAETPQPLPEPAPMEMPLPVNVTPQRAPGFSEGPSAAPDAPRDDALQEIRQQLQQLLAVSAFTAPPATTPAPVATTPARQQPRRIWLIVGVATAFALGYAAADWRRAPATAPGTAAPPNAAPAPADGSLVVSGRVTYLNAQGVSQPDVGARVLVLPAAWDGAARIPTAGLRLQDAEADRTVADALAQAMGGGAAFASESGEFRIPLSRSGDYRLLILSRFQARPDDPAADAQPLHELASVLAQPAEALGRLAYHLAPLPVRGDAPIIADHVFAEKK